MDDVIRWNTEISVKMRTLGQWELWCLQKDEQFILFYFIYFLLSVLE